VDLASLTPGDTTELLKSIERVNVLPVAFSDASEDIEGEKLLRAGYAGLLRRDAPTETVMRAVRAIANGELWFSRRTISRVLTTFLFEQHLKRLTSREIEILMLIGSGFSNQEIGNQLFISRETVRWHVRGLYSKLGIVNRPDALEYLRSLYGSGTRIPAQSETAKNTWSRLLTAR
jgi:DNA-binding NarL/FixJ family response regulator